MLAAGAGLSKRMVRLGLIRSTLRICIVSTDNTDEGDCQADTPVVSWDANPHGLSEAPGEARSGHLVWHGTFFKPGRHSPSSSMLSRGKTGRSASLALSCHPHG